MENTRAPLPATDPAPRAPLLPNGPALPTTPLDPPSRDLPATARDAHLRDRDGIAACDKAKVALADAIYRAVFGRRPSYGEVLRRARTPDIRLLLEAHDQACLQPLDRAPPAGGEAARIAAALAAIHPRMGAVFASTGPTAGRVHCTGLLLDAQHVATARHCLYDPDFDSSRGGTPPRIAVGFARWTEPDRPLQVAEPVVDPDHATGSFHRRQRVGDFAILRLAAPVADARVAAPMPMARPQAFQRITLVGLQVVLGYARSGEAPRVTPAQNWSPLLRHEVRADCRIAWTTARGCFLYGCNVEAGWSGGPVLAISDAEGGRPAQAALLGIHTGGIGQASRAEAESDCGARGDFDGMPSIAVNLGTAVPGWVQRRAGP
ncbi:trypsin-like serine peptidase [Falsiroseomonas selenitidurans]|uniref:S1 family peptidase n=1 Tax=Falsiroseomonas selenitidurans TaxID=2716335 RepID=A0ABX1E2A9_9PROT|nr:trypsin-like serine protease [Falsiroseomonas selenitidurans]NKC31188.1 S1 family peptidase [Falsiroseomonas selenitidurans]